MFRSLLLYDFMLGLSPSRFRFRCSQLFVGPKTDLRHRFMNPLLMNWMNRATSIISAAGVLGRQTPPTKTRAQKPPSLSLKRKGAPRPHHAAHVGHAAASLDETTIIMAN
jgi:hypothetical protein